MHSQLLSLMRFCNNTLLPVALLMARLKVGYVFLLSGKLKLGYVLNNQLDTLYFLFEDYKVPLLPVKAAAWMGMSGELGFGAMLMLGLFGRLGALGLIFMSGVIYFTDHNPQAVYWVLICAIVAATGSGKWSLDALIFKKFNADGANNGTPYMALRNLALAAKNAPLNTMGPIVGGLLGVMMEEMPEEGNLYCLVAWFNGDVCTFVKSKAGFVGTAQQPVPNEAARELVRQASDFKKFSRLTHSMPLPQIGNVMFYFITDSGVYQATAKTPEAREPGHPLRNLCLKAEETLVSLRPKPRA